MAKTMRERETELRALMATPAGLEELHAMGEAYRAAGAGNRPPRSSLITYILVYERTHGLIVG